MEPAAKHVRLALEPHSEPEVFRIQPDGSEISKPYVARRGETVL